MEDITKLKKAEIVDLLIKSKVKIADLTASAKAIERERVGADNSLFNVESERDDAKATIARIRQTVESMVAVKYPEYPVIPNDQRFNECGEMLSISSEPEPEEWRMLKYIHGLC